MRFQCSQQYSITALTDSAGTIKERYAYSAYGVRVFLDGSGTVLTSSAENNRYTYTGREWDDLTELYHYRARPYLPRLGRFASRDPIGYLDDASLYAFTSNRSTTRIDPTGLSGWIPNTGGKPWTPPGKNPNCHAKMTCNDVLATLKWGAGAAAGFGYGDDGDDGNALAHCILSCKVNNIRPDCNAALDAWEWRAKHGDLGSQLDLLNNAEGRKIQGRFKCESGCNKKLRKHELWCIHVGLIVNCHENNINTGVPQF